MNFRIIARKGKQFLLRWRKQIEGAFFLFVLTRRNLRSRLPVVCPDGPVVSLTSYGTRVRQVYLAIESIGCGTLLPSRIILWLDEVDAVAHPTIELQRLQARGLEIKLCLNYGPHKKYYPFVEAQDDFEKPLVTADDDIFYPRTWLHTLYMAHQKAPDYVHCLRARRIQVNAQGIAPYATWSMVQDKNPSYLNLATGCAGVIYPAALLRQIKLQGTAFLEVCPRADDLWLHAQALRSGFRIQQVLSREFPLCEIPGTQTNALYLHNFGEGNDSQIQTTYNKHDVEKLRQEAFSQGISVSE